MSVSFIIIIRASALRRNKIIAMQYIKGSQGGSNRADENFIALPETPDRFREDAAS